MLQGSNNKFIKLVTSWTGALIIAALVIVTIQVVKNIDWLAAVANANEVSCSSNTAKELIIQIQQQQLRKIPSLAFNVDGSSYAISAIRTIGDTRNGVSCSATLDIVFELSDDLKKTPRY